MSKESSNNIFKRQVSIYKTVMVFAGLKAILGITYVVPIVEGIKVYTGLLQAQFDIGIFLKVLDSSLPLLISLCLIVGLVFQLLHKKMDLNVLLKFSIAYYAIYFIIVNLPTLRFLDFLEYQSQMSRLEILRYCLNTFSIIALTVIYTIFSNHHFKNINHHSFVDVANNRKIRFFNYVIDILMILHLSFWPSQYEIFQNWNYPLIFALVATCYYVTMELSFRQTLGKVVTKTYVNHQESTYIGAILMRTVCRRIPFEPLSVFGPRIWHDKFSKTTLIKIGEDKKVEKS